MTASPPEVRHEIPFWLTAAVLAAFFVATPAWAVPICMQRVNAVENLQRKYYEAQVARGLTIGRDQMLRVVEVWRTKDGGTWTILVTRPNGMTCLVAEGSEWVNVPWALPDTPPEERRAYEG